MPGGGLPGGGFPGGGFPGGGLPGGGLPGGGLPEGLPHFGVQLWFRYLPGHLRPARRPYASGGQRPSPGLAPLGLATVKDVERSCCFLMANALSSAATRSFLCLVTAAALLILYTRSTSCSVFPGRRTSGGTCDSDEYFASSLFPRREFLLASSSPRRSSPDLCLDAPLVLELYIRCTFVMDIPARYWVSKIRSHRRREEAVFPGSVPERRPNPAW